MEQAGGVSREDRGDLVVDVECQPYRMLALTGCLPDRILRFRTRRAAEVALCLRPRRRFQLPTEVAGESLLHT